MQRPSTLGHEEAEIAIATVRDALIAAKKVAVVAVADAHGELIALLRLSGAPLPSVLVATNKAWTAARERRPSGDIGKAARDPQRGFAMSNFGDSRYIGWGGGLPVKIGAETVGAVAVSGLSEEEDAALAQLGIDAILRAQP
jgi:glc operon protein GlcG